MSFDVESFRLETTTPQKTVMSTEQAKKRASTRQKAPFLKGPIPIPWLGKAGALKRKVSLHLGLILWHQAGLENTKENLRLTARFKRLFNMKDRSVTNALNELEAAELITVLRAPGKCVLATILDVSGEES